MAFKIRQSKYRHIFCDTPKPEFCFTGFQLSTVTGEQQYIKASAKYFAIALRGGGGPIGICKLDRPGRFEPGTSSIVHGHTGSVLDFDWNPFDDSMFATASEDTTIKLWSVPDDWEPIDEKGHAKKGTNLSESLVDLVGHRKKVTLVKFHPTANNVLLSAATDNSVKVWDIEKSEVMTSFDDLGDLTYDIVWDTTGDNYAVSNKDKLIRLMDGRTSTVTSTLEKPHMGLKSMKCLYLGETGKFLTVGASLTNSREMKIWDLKNLSEPLATETIDNSSGALLPTFDADANILYLSGKGDGIIRPYEFEDSKLYKLNDGYRSHVPCKGMCMIPKRGNDIMHNETARLMKLTNNQGVQPLQFTVPRKSDAFQDDIFPDSASSEPAHTADEWLGGSSKGPVKMSLNPLNKGATGPKKAFKLRTVGQVSAELEKANKRVTYLEEKLKAAGIEY